MCARSCAVTSSRSRASSAAGRYIRGRASPKTKGEGANSLTYTPPASFTAVRRCLRSLRAEAPAHSSMAAAPSAQTAPAAYTATYSGLTLACGSAAKASPSAGFTAASMSGTPLSIAGRTA